MRASFSQPPRAGAASPAARARELLKGEADIAFRRRAITIVDYLDPRPGDRILDAGCGLGFYLALLSLVSESRLVGIELDRGRLRPAAEDSLVRAAFFEGDVTHLPFANASFDKLILSEVLEHLPEDEPAVREAARVLRPGGVLAVSVPHAGYPFLWDPLNWVRERLGLGHFRSEPWSGIWTDHRRLYTKEALSALVEEAGLLVTDTHLETRYSFPFAHHLVYGAGRYMLERGLVRGEGTGPAKRWTLWGPKPRGALALALRLFTAPDRYNRPRYESGPAVGVLLRAVKPQ
jgi:SAM-dependent methyltransferase